MKAKHKIIAVITTIIIMVGLIIRPLGVSASSGTYYLLDIGTYGQLGQYLDNNANTGYTYKYVVTISLKAKYNGTIGITTSTNITNTDRIATYNCELDNSSNTLFTLRIYNSSFCSFTYETNNSKTFTPSSNSLTKVADIDYYPQLGDINTKLTNVYSKIDDLETYSQSTNAYIALIQAETNDINTSVDNIESDVDIIRQGIATSNTSLNDINTNTTTIKNDVSNMLTTLTTMSADISNGVADIVTINTTLSGISQNLSNLYARVNEINQNVADIEYILNNNILPAINGITNAVNNIDNAIDNITWLYDDVEFLGVTTDFSTYTYSGSGVENCYAVFQLTNSLPAKDYLYHIRVYLDSRNQNNNEALALNYVTGTNNALQQVEILYYENSRYYHDYYFKFRNVVNLTSPLRVSMKFSQATYTATQIQNNSYLGYLKQEDIEYWQLMSCFNEYRYYVRTMEYESGIESKLDDIISAINNIHINVTEQDIDNITNNFDNDITTIHNVEVNFDNSFGNYDGSISDNDIALNLTPYSPTFSLIKSNVTSLWTSDLIKIPITLSCLVFIFLVILG